MSKTKISILVVEDEVLLLQAITKKLQIMGIEPVGATTGKQAIDYLNNLTEVPKAIWLDYYLKDMNGLDFMQQVKKNPKWAEIPIFVVSNSAGDDKVKSMLSLGANKYMLKAEHRLEDIITDIVEFVK